MTEYRIEEKRRLNQTEDDDLFKDLLTKLTYLGIAVLEKNMRKETQAVNDGKIKSTMRPKQPNSLGVL